MNTLQNTECRNFDQPDEQLDFKSRGRIDIVKLKDGTAGMHAILKAGWKWSVDEKPLIGNPESCPMSHTGYCLDGELLIQIVTTGKSTVIKKGDFFNIPAGHDATVTGTEACELILFQAPEATH